MVWANRWWGFTGDGLTGGLGFPFAGCRGPVLLATIFPDAKGHAGGQEAEEDVKNDRGRSGEVMVEPVEDLSAVDHGEEGLAAIADRARNAESGEKLAARDAEGSGGEQKGQQRDGRRKQGGDTDAEEAVVFHPLLNAGAESLGDVTIDHRLAAFFACFPGGPAADEGAEDGGRGEKPGRLAVRAEDKDQDVGTAGDGEGERRGIEKSDGKDAGKAEMQRPGGDEFVVRVLGCLRGREVHAR